VGGTDVGEAAGVVCVDDAGVVGVEPVTGVTADPCVATAALAGCVVPGTPPRKA
jgi:hypothetical protein